MWAALQLVHFLITETSPSISLCLHHLLAVRCHGGNGKWEKAPSRGSAFGNVWLHCFPYHEQPGPRLNFLLSSWQAKLSGSLSPAPGWFLFHNLFPPAYWCSRLGKFSNSRSPSGSILVTTEGAGGWSSSWPVTGISLPVLYHHSLQVRPSGQQALAVPLAHWPGASVRFWRKPGPQGWTRSCPGGTCLHLPESGTMPKGQTVLFSLTALKLLWCDQGGVCSSSLFHFLQSLLGLSSPKAPSPRARHPNTASPVVSMHTGTERGIIPGIGICWYPRNIASIGALLYSLLFGCGQTHLLCSKKQR